MENWQQRTELLVGENGLEKLRNASVLVVGLGGVGGIAAEMICRAGVGNMTIVDADVVSVSNINRQIVALHSTVGRCKTEVLGERLRDINPEINLTLLTEMLEMENIIHLLDGGKFDMVIDAIDTLSPKVFLITSCLERNINIISSMGSGAKTDPSKIKIADISNTEYCALAKSVRQRLAKQGIRKGLPVIFSTESADRNAIVSIDEKYKKSTTGTISYLPTIFGCFLASYAIREIIATNK